MQRPPLLGMWAAPSEVRWLPREVDCFPGCFGLDACFAAAIAAAGSSVCEPAACRRAGRAKSCSVLGRRAAALRSCLALALAGSLG